MSEVISFMKHKVVCPCKLDSCKVFGIPRDNKNGHVKGCCCKPCANGENRKRGVSEQVKLTKDAGGKVSTLRPGNEESLRLAYRVEFKSELPVGPRKVRGPIQNLYDWFGTVAAQSEAAKAHGDIRPFLAGASLVGEPYRLFVIRTDKFADVIEAAIEWRSSHA